MIRPLDRSTPWGRTGTTMAATAILLVGVVTTLAGEPTRGPRPVAVVAGGSELDLEGGPAATLVIVSSLARDPGPFEVRLKALTIASPGAGQRPVVAEGPARVRATPALGPLPIPRPEDLAPAPSRAFHMLVRDGDVASASNYLRIDARLAASGERVQVYVDEREAGAVDPGLIREVVETFDRDVYPTAARRFGPAEDVDGDGRFAVLVSGWLDRLAGGRIRVDGFVRGADFDAGLSAPFGNGCDMMYLSPSLRPGPHLKTVLAHEYTHAVTFSRRAFPAGPDGRLGAEEEGWLDEGLAHLVEDLHGFSRSNLDYRVSAFLSRPERYRLVVDDYYAADLFRSHGNRGGAYLFLRWCVDRHGEGVLDRLVRSKLRGTANLEAATGRPFEDLYREWTTALFLSGLDPASDRGEQAGYRGLDPRGTMADWVLAGPRSSRVRPDGPADTWSASGTSPHYVVVEGSARGPVRVEVSGPPSARLQVTVVPLPEGLGGIELDVRPALGRDGVLSVRARVRATGGVGVRLGAIAWEPLVPQADPRAPGFRRAGLDRVGIEHRFGTTSLDVGGRLDSGPIPLDGVRPGDGPVVFKAVGTDAQGRRVAGWAEVEIPRDGTLGVAVDAPGR